MKPNKPTSSAKPSKVSDREIKDDPADTHEDCYKDGGKVARGTATQRGALFKHRKNRSK